MSVKGKKHEEACVGHEVASPGDMACPHHRERQPGAETLQKGSCGADVAPPAVRRIVRT